MIECVDVRRVFGEGDAQVRALRGVSLSVEPGAMTCIYGSSGSGKSTLLNIIAGLDEPTSGDVHVLGTDIPALSWKERARFRLEHIGVVFQDNNLIAEFSALENVILPLQGQGHSLQQARRLAEAALEQLGVAEQTNKRPNKMSGGQRQRVGIARAIAGDKAVLLADEPTGALDSENSKALFQALAAIAEQGRTVLVATHDPLARGYAGHTSSLRDGLRVDATV